MSEEYQRPAADWRPKCHNHGPDGPAMEPAILRLNYPEGSLPVRGFRCGQCGDDAILAADGADNRHMAEELGLFGPTDLRSRKILQTGSSIAVSIDPQLAREVLGDVRPGDAVVMGRRGRWIVIGPAEKDPLAFAKRVPKAPISAKKWLRRVEADRETTRVDA